MWEVAARLTLAIYFWVDDEQPFHNPVREGLGGQPASPSAMKATKATPDEILSLPCNRCRMEYLPERESRPLREIVIVGGESLHRGRAASQLPNLSQNEKDQLESLWSHR
jgi:hypothetical protein